MKPASSLPVIRRRPVDRVPALGDIPPLLARILAARGINAAEQLNLSLAALPRPEGLPGIESAVDLLLQARQANWKILVVGDYDADGATATVLMLQGLPLLGFAQPGFLVPDRFVYGYGLSTAIVELALANGKPDLIITVDNGIASVEGVAAARAAGIHVLITDHHLPGDQLPEADAVLNPRLDPEAPGQCLAGVGVALYLLLALRARLRQLQDSAGNAPLAELLDLVALGTVADVVPLDQTNRVLVEQGLRRIRAGQCRPGILALLQISGRDPARVVAADLGFAVGPRLNAAGRLADMAQGVHCLLAHDADRAEQMATELDSINRQRRDIEQGMRDAALEEVERLRQRHEVLPPALCLHDPGWHEGVVGILASRIKESTHRPVIAFAPASQPGMLKGSGRSLPGLHLRDVLDRIATSHPGMLEKFGGHAMAAGMTLSEVYLEDFRQAFSQTVEAMAPRSLFDEIIETDGPLEGSEISLKTARLLNTCMPWGQGFPPPLFEGEFEVLEQRVVGERHLKLVLGLGAGGSVVDAIHFNAAINHLPGRLRQIHGVYRLDVNHFRGQSSPQLIFEHLGW